MLFTNCSLRVPGIIRTTNALGRQKAVQWFMRLAATLTSRRPEFNLRPFRVASGGQSITGTGFCPITSGSPLSVSFHQSPGWNSVPRGERPARVYEKQTSPELYELVCAYKVRSYLADTSWCKSAVMWEPLGSFVGDAALPQNGHHALRKSCVVSEGCMLREAAEP
jgi:hypothetical protein